MRRIRKQAGHETLAMQRLALIGEPVTDFSVGDRVMTVDGLPGRVAEVLDGPYQSVEDYRVILDHGMGGGSYGPGQLRALKNNTAAVVEASEVYASIPVEAVTNHTANLDYPELENILTERLPNENIRVFAANNTAQDDNDDDDSDKLNQQSDDTDDSKDPDGVEEGKPVDEPDVDEDTEQTGPELPNVTPPSSCSYCGSTNFGDPQMTGRGTRMRCEDCQGTMVSSGGQWQPEFPNSSQNNASEQGDSRSGGVGGVASLPDSNFKTGMQTDAGLINWVIDKIYDRIQERSEKAMLSKNWAAPSHLEDYAGPNGTCSVCQAHNYALPDPQPHALTAHSSLNDGEWGFHLTASWMDVQAKARRIRSEGHVKIVEANKIWVVGEVKGDQNVYETQLNYVPGTKKVADWACGCKWASYTWGRSKPFARFEGRLCSHALALQYEAGARGMFGKDVHHDETRPSWQKAHQPIVVQFDKDTDKNLTRRAVPPGNMKRTFSALTLDSDGIYPEATLLDLVRPPIYAFAVNMLNHDESVTSVIQMLANFGVERESARELTHAAWSEPASDGPESHAKHAMADGWYTEITNGLEDHTASSAVNEILWDQNAEPRDLSDHDEESDHKHNTDGEKKNKHRTNDGREHAPHWGWGMDARDLMECPQCTGSGCGHCAGQGQVSAAEESGTQSLTDKTPDQTQDAGVASTTDGLSTGSSLHIAATEVGSPLPEDGNNSYASPTYKSNSPNPASTGWATSQDPGDWGRSLISNNFGVTFDASLHTTAQATNPFEGPTVSGVALKAHDTGRVLMIQRSNKDDKDPAKGTWEFPGGHHEEGDQTSLHAGIREWEEEVGQQFPHGGHVSHTWRSGPYQGHVVVIPSESHVDFSKGRSESNPDDPDGDDHEQAAWWDPEHAKKNPALRSELKGHGAWGDIKKAASIHEASLDEVMGVYTTLHDDPEAALPSTDGGQDDNNAADVPAGDSVDGPHVGGDDASSIREAFLRSAGAAAIAGGDKELLAKVAMKAFNHQEQQELINEGVGDRARNFNDLRIEGTHYTQIPDESEDETWWL